MTIEPFDLDAFREHVLSTTRGNQPLTPQGDWTGVLLIEAGNEMSIIPTSPYRTSRQVWTKALTVWFPALVVEKDAVAYALVDHIWESGSEVAQALGPLADPDRKEAVLVSVGARVGNQEIVHESWDARVSRLGHGPPLLGPWREHVLAEGDRFGPLQAALHHLAQQE